jgi:hypothetical protein
MSKAKKRISKTKKQSTKIPVKERSGSIVKTGIRAGGYGPT